MFSLYIEAPFAVFRTFTAGWFRPTATFMTPTAAYGLLLNLAGIETRLREEDPEHPGSTPTTLMHRGLPAMKLAIGVSSVRLVRRQLIEIESPADRFPRVQTMFQQLHNYPVGASGGERAVTTFGNKYNITPVRREILVGLRAILAVTGSEDLEREVLRSLSNDAEPHRYGLPFVGDNSFLPDRIVHLNRPVAAHWYERVTAESSMIQDRTARLPQWIDRANLSQTMSQLYAPTKDAVEEVPSNAWTEISPP